MNKQKSRNRPICMENKAMITRGEEGAGGKWGKGRGRLPPRKWQSPKDKSYPAGKVASGVGIGWEGDRWQPHLRAEPAGQRGAITGSCT